MLQFASLHPTIGIQQQLGGESEGPVVLLNLFTVAEADADGLLEAWRDDAAYFKRQPGFISAQLHEGLGGRAAYLNYAVWESPWSSSGRPSPTPSSSASWRPTQTLSSPRRTCSAS
jgi:hypothetical protein